MQTNKTRNILLGGFLALFILNAFGLYLWQREKRESATLPTEHTTHKEKELYHCPMHPAVVSDKPGQCPICKMDLVKVDEPDKPVSSERKILFYRHPMQPNVTSKVPAKDEMGMDYIPVYEDSETGTQDTSVQGRAAFSLPEESQQRIGVTTTIVSKQSLAREIRVTGRVAYDPDLFAAIEEYRQAVTTGQQLRNSSYQGFVDQSAALVKSSETRLKLLGLTEEQIQKIARGGSNAMNLILPEGRVWIYAEVFEYEVGGIKPGQTIEAEAPSIPGEIFRGKVSSISPVLNAPTRTVRVRAEVPDPKGLLRPDTYLNIRIKSDLGQKVAVPEDSVLYSGSEAFVFVKDHENRFHPKPVQLGVKANGYHEVLAGLSVGDAVVTSANFLVDSESRLKAVLMQNDGSSTPEKGGQP